MLNNSSLIDKTVQITIAKITSSSINVDKKGGTAVAVCRLSKLLEYFSSNNPKKN